MKISYTIKNNKDQGQSIKSMKHNENHSNTINNNNKQ